MLQGTSSSCAVPVRAWALRPPPMRAWVLLPTTPALFNDAAGVTDAGCLCLPESEGLSELGDGGLKPYFDTCSNQDLGVKWCYVNTKYGLCSRCSTHCLETCQPHAVLKQQH